MPTKDEIRQEWVAALRSGEYKQTEGGLRNAIPKADKHAYCCLGVLCEIYKKYNQDLITPEDYGYAWDYNPDCMHEDYPPSQVAMEWAGMSSCEGFMEILPKHLPQTLRDEYFPDVPDDWDKSKTLSLATLNDTGASFEDIASIIEAKPDGLFE